MEGAAPPARTVTVTHVVVHTHTVTQTQTAAPTEQTAAPAESSGSTGGEGSYSGNGTKNLGSITVSQPSVIHWRATEGLFELEGFTSGYQHSIGIASKASSGESVIEPGTYHEVQVDALGEWSFTITPQG